MKKLRAILFDIDDTLYSTSEFAALARRNSVRAMIQAGLRMEEGELTRELQEVVAEFSSNYEHHFDKLLLRIPAHTYAGLNRATLVAAGVVAYHDTKFTQLKIYEDVLEVLKLLSQTELTLGVISVGSEVKQAEKLIRLKLLPYLDPRAIFISDQIGVSKPNVKLYMRACQELGVLPAEAMYIGDNPINDIDPPNKLGMVTVHNKRTGKYTNLQGKTQPDHEIHDFWDLLDIVEKHYGVKVKRPETKQSPPR